MALYHVFDEVENRRTGIPMSGVIVKAYYRGTTSVAPIFADENGTPFAPENQTETDVDGMYSFYVGAGEYDLHLLVGTSTIKVIENFTTGLAGPTGPANSTYETTFDLKLADVTNLSAILTEVGKAGTFVLRNTVDFTAEIAADTEEKNYIVSTAVPENVWVRASILPEGASFVGMADGRNVEGVVASKANAAALGVSGAANDMGAFSGSTISDNVSAKAALQELEAALESTSASASEKANATAVGVDPIDVDMGTFAGSTIPDNQTAKEALQSLETATEARPTTAALADPSGAGLIGFKQDNISAVSRTALEKLRDVKSPSDNGASSIANGVVNAASIQSILAAFPVDTVQRGAVSFRPGEELQVSTEILLHRKNMKIDGQNAVLKWEGAAGASMFRVTDSHMLSFQNLTLIGDDANPPSAGIRFFRNGTADNKGTNEGCAVRGVTFGRKFASDTTTGGSADATPYGPMQYGILVDGVDGNNDEFIIDNVQVNGATVAGIGFLNTQSIWSLIQNSLVNDCEVGYYFGCNTQFLNIHANRCRTADIMGIRNTRFWINGFYAENSKVFGLFTAGAGAFIKGGRLLKNTAVIGNFFRAESAGPLVLEDLWISNSGGSGDTIYYRSGSVSDSYLKVRNCQIQNGNLRSTWDIEVTNIAPSIDIDIEHGIFKFKTHRPYLDRAVEPVATAAGASQIVNAAATITAGALWNVSYGADIKNQQLSPAPDTTGLVRAIIFNPTAGSLTLDPSRMRWMDLGDHVVASAKATVDVPLLANGAIHLQEVDLPGALPGDYIAWGAETTFINSVVTAYCNAPNKVTLAILNASGGVSDPPSTVFTLAKLSRFGNFQNTLAYIPAEIAIGATVDIEATLTGAQMGSHLFVSYSASLKGLTCTIGMGPANKPVIVLTNKTAAPITLDAGYFNLMAAF